VLFEVFITLLAMITDFTGFNVHGSVHRKNILIYIQQDATLHSLFYLENCSTCFGCYLHPSSEAYKLYLQHLVIVTPLLLPGRLFHLHRLNPKVN